MKSINFSGIQWNIKDGKMRGPGPNNWSEQNVFVDGDGALHLRIREINGIWCCAEISSANSVQYGEYTFYLATNIEYLDPKMMIGLFFYENDQKEIDIEFINKQAIYSIQPDEHLEFELNLQGSYSKHKILFYPNRVEFSSYHGHNSGHLIQYWKHIIGNQLTLSKTFLHINFWLKRGIFPKTDAEIVINSVKIEAC